MRSPNDCSMAAGNLAKDGACGNAKDWGITSAQGGNTVDIAMCK